MRPSDIVKALIVGALALGLLFLAVWVVVQLYAIFVAPPAGAAAPHAEFPALLSWSMRLIGSALLLVFALWFCRWGACRSALGFAAFVFAGYALTLAVAIAVLHGHHDVMTPAFGVTLAINFVGAMLGGSLGLWRRTRDRAVIDPE